MESTCKAVEDDKGIVRGFGWGKKSPGGTEQELSQEGEGVHLIGGDVLDFPCWEP